MAWFTAVSGSISLLYTSKQRFVTNFIVYVRTWPSSTRMCDPWPSWNHFNISTYYLKSCPKPIIKRRRQRDRQTLSWRRLYILIYINQIVSMQLLTASNQASCSAHWRWVVHAAKSETCMATCRVNLMSLTRDFRDHFFFFIPLTSHYDSAKGHTVFFLLLKQAAITMPNFLEVVQLVWLMVGGKCHASLSRSVQHRSHVTIGATAITETVCGFKAG